MATPAVPVSSAYSGPVLKIGSSGPQISAIQARLNALGYGPLRTDGNFTPQLTAAVEAFQARAAHSDLGQAGAGSAPHALAIDGVVGPMTWAALFAQPVPLVIAPCSALAAEAITIAQSQVGVMEQPLGSNRGPQVDQYLRCTGLDPARGSYPWCAAFVYWCFDQAAQKLQRQNPLVKTAGVLDAWDRSLSHGARELTSAQCAADPTLIEPGMIFVLAFSGGEGHMGLVEHVQGVLLTTIEGNTNAGGSREGVGVFRRTRHISAVNRGFLAY